jgi:vacuolar protein sorting-associated protein 18
LNNASFELAEPLYYKHASIFLSRSPVIAGESFLYRYADGLSPMRLLPSIMRYEKARVAQIRDHTKDDSTIPRGPFGSSEESKTSIDPKDGPSSVSDSNVAINYLEGVVKQGCRNGAVFRYLLSLYIAMKNEEPLLEFLSTHVSPTSSLVDATKKAILAGDRPIMGADDPSSTPLDMSYALRAVLGTGRHFRSAIKLYMGFGMRSQAVELALKVDPPLARQLAQGSVELEERKRLWLMIAKTAAVDGTSTGKDVVPRVVSVLKDCGPDVLSIEDVLPFLPDFAQIDQIKDEICEALTSYSSKIEGYLREMNDCDQVCNDLREEISRLRKYHMRVKADARCAFTQKLVLSAGEPFYAFPSGYVVLASALKSEVSPYLTDKQRKRVEELEGLIQTGGSEKPTQALQSELDGILAAECPLTGSIMVESIDKLFPLNENEFADGINTTVDRIDV